MTVPDAEERAIAQVAGWIAEARRIVVLTGAGISTESGIPDFRGPDGVWTKDPAAERRATIDHYVANRGARVSSWQNRLSGGMFAAEPNAGHSALAELGRTGRLHLLVTQNVDGLHHAAGNDPDRIVEIHGTVRDFRCLGCGESGPIERVLARVAEGDEDPHCSTCGGLLKTATISFGQSLIPEDLERAQMAAAVCDLFVAVGTSLGVYPAAALPEIALRAGARLVVANAEPTPYDEVASAVLRGRLGTVLPAVVAGANRGE